MSTAANRIGKPAPNQVRGKGKYCLKGRCRMESVFIIGLIVVCVWALWMATCRPEQWEKLVENSRRRRRERLQGALKLGGMAFKTYKRWK